MSLPSLIQTMTMILNLPWLLKRTALIILQSLEKMGQNPALMTILTLTPALKISLTLIPILKISLTLIPTLQTICSLIQSLQSLFTAIANLILLMLMIPLPTYLTLIHLMTFSQTI
ncbi:hypothetical protein CLU79DRAFT_738073 [Phycomyces nitens]|nr:hypothetical protein CLU79DRAFT_738073 [Phycomyces nitens]